MATVTTLGTPVAPTVASVNNDATIVQQALVYTWLTVIKEHQNRNISLMQAGREWR